jgi:hypothetical protein
MHQTFSGDVELTRRLEAFAVARLSPDAAAVRRMRSRVMREARARLEMRATAGADRMTDGGAIVVPIHLGHGHRGLRRVAGLLLAAALAVSVVGGAALAAAPGGPLYATALWLEELTLPSGGEARAQADLGRLQRRLDEARAAAASGDGTALAAALAAYGVAVDDAVATAGTNEAWLARLKVALGNHLAVLAALTADVPEQARHAIEQAIVKSSGARDRIGGPDGPNGPDGPSTPNTPGAPAPARTPEPEPARTPKPEPDKTSKPAKTPAPEPPPAEEPRVEKPPAEEPAVEEPRATSRADQIHRAGPLASAGPADR